MSSDVQWPSDSRILSRLAWLEIRDLSCDRDDQRKLAEAWITAAESWWHSQRDSRISGRWAAIA